ncbi:MAG: DNA damage-inducible protein D [Tannerella sp.]|jgi:DNA-damage-inducible protein D|nr:DNA damage-inducible protein D [Tannerella sp.]
MKESIQKKGQSIFEQIKKIDDKGNEYWSARDMAKVLEYSEYRHFMPVIERAKEACYNSGFSIADHFEDILEMVMIGSNAEREVDSVKFSRYACYLIVQNADPSKEVVALGQTYFAIQTRLQEIRQMDEYNRLNTEDEKRLFLRNEMAKHNTHLAAAAKDAGVIEPLDYAIFQKSWLYGFVWWIRCKSHTYKERTKEKPANTRPYGKYRVGSKSFSGYSN